MTDRALHRVSWTALAGAVLVLLLVLLLPGKFKDLHADTFLRLPLELPVLVLAFTWLRGRLIKPVQLVVVLLLGLTILLRLADMGTRLSFGRRFNPLLDVHLVQAGWKLASGSIGLVQAMLIAAVALVLLIGLMVLLYRAFGAFARLRGRQRRQVAAAALLLFAIGLTLQLLQPLVQRDLRVQADLPRDMIARVVDLNTAIADQAIFAGLLRTDPLAGTTPDFAALQGRDVIVIFIESYGRGFVEGPGYRDRATTRLTRLENDLDAAGLGMRSGWLRSSVQGGRSWLTHATLMSGLRITNQGRFTRLVTSTRRPLTELFEDAGWRTAGVMPAMTERVARSRLVRLRFPARR